MKKLVLLLLFTTLCLSVSAQNYKNDGKPYAFYCQFVCEMQTSGRVTFKRIVWDDIKSVTKITDKDGKVVEFNNAVQAMNFMSKRGWTFVESGLYSGFFIYTFAKTVTNDKEAREGLYFESDFKNKD